MQLDATTRLYPQTCIDQLKQACDVAVMLYQLCLWPVMLASQRSPELRVGCRYKDWLKVLVLRVNTVNGRVYAQDPTIFAWDLINEPRCSNCKPGTIAVRGLSKSLPLPVELRARGCSFWHAPHVIVTCQ